jgi:type IV secretory pathway TraG/TraD family ATPase VirD4
MSPRALGPRQPVTASTAMPGWMVLGCCWILIIPAFLVWAAAWTAAALGGGHVTSFGIGFAEDLAGRRTAAAWPGVSTPLVITCTCVLAAALTAIVWFTWVTVAPRFMHAPDDPVAALARHRSRQARLTLDSVAQRAVQLRRSLNGRRPRDITEDDAGIMLGDMLRPGQPPGPPLLSTWEETEVDFMGPRSGKTTSRAVPVTLAAPGPVLATSNKADLWAATHAIRGATGTVWLFDPCRITYQAQGFWWNPLASVDGVEAAHRLASHFVLTVEDQSKRELWGPAAQTLLTALFLAAAATPGRDLNDVARWLDQPAMPAPATLLDAAGYRNLASSLMGTQNGAHETRDGIYETARTAAKSLRDEQVMRWVTPQPGLPVLTPASFPGSTDTLFLLSESRHYAAPLIAAITDLVIRAGLRLAQQSGGRLDPPLPVVLDEAANICRIADLPDLYSYLGSHGICPITILQSYEQGEGVWGDKGMAALWGAATIKLIGAGVDSPRLTRDVSTLVGQHDVPVRSLTLGEARGGVSEQLSLRRQEILEPAAVREITPGTALLLASGVPPAFVRLRTWFTGPRREEIAAHITDATELIRAGATGESPVPR